MKVEIIKHYAEPDLTFKGDYVIDLIVDGEVIYKEIDEYHDNAMSIIDGFLDCLQHLKIDFVKTTTQIADCALLN